LAIALVPTNVRAPILTRKQLLHLERAQLIQQDRVEIIQIAQRRRCL
jgi:hypothetical protein